MATAVLKSAFLLDAGLPSVAFQGFDFYSFRFPFASGDSRSFMGGSDVVHCVRFCDSPASWLDLGASGNAEDLFLDITATM